MSIRLELAFDLSSQPDASRASSFAYEQALEMCAWADRVGFHALSFGEHHCNSSHYLSSPLVMGAAASGRTHRTDIRMVLVTPFYWPLRLAEDLAVVTLSNGGRTLAVLAAGYRQAEFDFYGVSLDERSASIDETVGVLRNAWSGKPFSYQGRHIDIVSPVPDPIPRIVLAGASPLMARKAAQLGLDFAPTKADIYELYRQECQALGAPDPGPPPTNGPHFLHVTEDPEKAWAEIAPYVLANAQMYAGFLSGTTTAASVSVPATSLDDLKRAGAHVVVTPDECIALLSGLGERGRLRNHAMPSGLDPKLVWESLELFEAKVMPELELAPIEGR